MGIFISPSTSKKQVHFLHEVLHVDTAHMSFGKYTLCSVYGTYANGTMTALGFALLFGNEDKQSWMQYFGTSLIRHTKSLTSPTIQSSPTRTRVLYWQWKILSHWQEGAFVSSITDRTLLRNAVVEMVQQHCLICGCTISSSVASQPHHF